MSNKKNDLDYDLDNLAKLSKISLSNEEKQEFGTHIESMIGFMDNLKQVDTSNINNNDINSGHNAYLRDDLTNKNNLTKDILKNAPSSDIDNHILISKIL